MLTSPEERLLEHLSQYVTDHRKKTVEQVLNDRTRYITVVLDDIFHSQNSSAAIRTCECHGLQDVHIIENENMYSVNRGVLKGASKWMTFHRYRDKSVNNTAQCFESLREKGYTILATDPDERHDTLESVSLDKPVALVFGNELNGLSEYAYNQCDKLIRIPLYGFTKSFNISVTVAICLSTLMNHLRSSNRLFHLSDDEKKCLKLHWYKKIVRRSEVLEREFLRSIG